MILKHLFGRSFLALFMTLIFFSFGLASFKVLYYTNWDESLFLPVFSFFLNLILLIIFLILVRQYDNDRKEKQKILNLLEPRMAAIDSVKDAIYICDKDYKIRYTNPALLDTYDYKKEDLAGADWHILYPEAQKQWISSDILPYLKDVGRWHSHIRGRKKEGEDFSQDVTFSSLEDGGWIAISRDHSEIIEYVDLANNRLAAIEAAGDGIGLVDQDGNISYMNKACMVLHGISREDYKSYMGQYWENLYDDEVQKLIHSDVYEALDQNDYWKGEISIQAGEGEERIAEVSITLLPSGGLIVTSRDITNKKQAEKEKSDLQKQFFQAQKMEAIGRLTGGIAHDFNNILASVMGYTEFLLEDLDPKSKEYGFVENIMKGGHQARDLIDQILTFSRKSEAGQDVIDITDLIDELTSILQASIPPSVSVNIQMPEQGLYTAVNQTQIRQLVMNLCVNAIDAMDGEGRLKISAAPVSNDDIPAHLFQNEAGNIKGGHSVMVDPDNNDCAHMHFGILDKDVSYLVFTVEDTGTGIPQDIMENIFEPFFTTKDVHKGTGLGLSSAHGIVLNHKGAMTVKSTLDHGTAFNVFLPIDNSYQSKSSKKASGQVDNQVYTILLVEDQPDVQDMMEQMLNRMGHFVTVCKSGNEAIDLLSDDSGGYDLVITDYMMPGMDGLEFCRNVDQDFDHLPVIMMTGYPKANLVSQRKKLKCLKGIMKKPINKNMLLTHIRRAMKS